jgi:AcrR family transcriptional regulator
VRALYRYFPNKHAIVLELARRMASDWSDSLDGLGSLADPNAAWRALWSSYIDGFVSAVRATPGGRAVLLAMRADPDLRRVDDAANENYIIEISSELVSRAPGLSAAEARRVATVLMRSTVAVVDEVFDSDDSAGAELLCVLKAMHFGLLGQYLDDPE